MGKAFFYNDQHPEGLQEVFRRWGLGKTCGIDLPSEGTGRIPDAKWKESYFTDASAEDRQRHSAVTGMQPAVLTP